MNHDWESVKYSDTHSKAKNLEITRDSHLQIKKDRHIEKVLEIIGINRRHKRLLYEGFGRRIDNFGIFTETKKILQ